MNKAILGVAALSLVAAAPVYGQRRFRVGPTYSSITLEDLSGNAHSFSSFGGSAALITGDEGETGLTVARYHDLSTDGSLRRLTLFGLDSYYYPIGARGVAPFAATELGLARGTESAPATQCPPLLCQDTVSTSSQLALAFGLGVRVNLGSSAVAALEGRFLQVPGSQIQSLEARLNASVALGRQHRGDFLEGTLGPAASVFFPVSGALRARAPFAGVRFRRDTKKAGTVGLQIDFAPLRLTASCSPMGCNEPNAILFAPGYETALRPPWWGWVARGCRPTFIPMRVTTWAEYGLLVSLNLAKRAGQGPVAARELAEHERLPHDYVEQILLRLRRAGLVDSVRGAKGGYHLAREPQAITIKDVIEASEHVTFEVNCEPHPVHPQRRTPDASCSIRPVWRMLEQRINDLLASVSLADLMHDERELYQIAGVMAGN